MAGLKRLEKRDVENWMHLEGREQAKLNGHRVDNGFHFERADVTRSQIA